VVWDNHAIGGVDKTEEKRCTFCWFRARRRASVVRSKPVVVVQAGHAPRRVLLHLEAAHPVAAPVRQVGVEAFGVVAAHRHVAAHELTSTLLARVVDVPAEMCRYVS